MDDKKKMVSVVKIPEEPDNYQIRASLEKALKLIEDVNFHDDDIIAIKPNLGDLRPSEMGCTTDIRIIEALILIIREYAKNTQILIIESDHWLATANEGYMSLGYTELAEKYDIRLINITREKKITINVDGLYLKSIRIPQLLQQITKFISVAKLKTHSQYRLTCILKNQFGLISSRYKSKYHPYMNEVLYDLNKVFNPDLCIVDGIIGMEGNGPSDGNPINSGILICGFDPLITDIVASKIMGIKPKKVPYIKFAIKHDCINKDEIKVLGDAANISLNFTFIPFISYSLNRLSLKMIRIGNSTLNVFEKLSNLTSMLSGAIILFSQGYLLSPNYGLVKKNNAKTFLKDQIRRIYYQIRLKLY